MDSKTIVMENPIECLSALSLAINQYGDIKPCEGKESLNECLTLIEGPDHLPYICFWFNTLDGSTHVVIVEKRKDR